ncbi:MAG TPA: flagellar biosynthetic protein FliO [Bacillales bacterium]|nr:flagellar biosynthetic protein FliO [Bacillales bacterium]
MRKRWLVVILAAAFVFVFGGDLVHASGGGKDNRTVADLYKDQVGQKENGDTPDSEMGASAGTGSTLWMFVKVVFILAVVVALIYLLLRFVNAKTRSFSSGRAIQTISGVNVGSNRSVQLVKVGTKILVIGVGDTVTLLKEIDDEDEVKQLTNIHEKDDVIDTSVGKLKDWINTKQAGRGEPNGGFKAMLEKRLNEMVEDRKRAVDRLKRKGGPR